MLTMKDLVTNGVQSSPDGKHWEPALPIPSYFLKDRLRDAWAVFMRRATAVRQTRREDVDGE